MLVGSNAVMLEVVKLVLASPDLSPRPEVWRAPGMGEAGQQKERKTKTEHHNNHKTSAAWLTHAAACVCGGGYFGCVERRCHKMCHVMRTVSRKVVRHANRVTKGVNVMRSMYVSFPKIGPISTRTKTSFG